MNYAFQYIMDNHGVDTEDYYPYEGIDDVCRFDPYNIGAIDQGFVNIEHGDEQALMEAVATVGPISVAIDASHGSFHFYRDGIYYDAQCSSYYLDHAVRIIALFFLLAKSLYIGSTPPLKENLSQIF